MYFLPFKLLQLYCSADCRESPVTLLGKEKKNCIIVIQEHRSVQISGWIVIAILPTQMHTFKEEVNFKNTSTLFF